MLRKATSCQEPPFGGFGGDWATGTRSPRGEADVLGVDGISDFNALHPREQDH
jgi:hypothetical protein